MGESQQETGRPLPAEAAVALASRRTIDAIKAVRLAKGLGLAEARRRLIRAVFIIDFALVAIVAWWFFSR